MGQDLQRIQCWRRWICLEETVVRTRAEKKCEEQERGAVIPQLPVPVGLGSGHRLRNWGVKPSLGKGDICLAFHYPDLF